MIKSGMKCPKCGKETVGYEPPGEPNPSILKVRCRYCKKIYEVLFNEVDRKVVLMEKIPISLRRNR